MWLPTEAYVVLLALIGALPVAGFVIGARWMYVRDRLRRPEQPVTPLPAAAPESRVLDAIESMRGQLSELAERQDFTERMIIQRLGALETERENTPV